MKGYVIRYMLDDVIRPLESGFYVYSLPGYCKLGIQGKAKYQVPYYKEKGMKIQYFIEQIDCQNVGEGYEYFPPPMKHLGPNHDEHVKTYIRTIKDDA